MAVIDADAFFLILFEVLAAVGMGYILIRVYRERTRKVRKLR